MNNQFIYSVLQYKHSLALGEAINIGVLFSFPDENKLQFVPGNTNRVKCVYPNFDSTIFTRISRNIKDKVAFHAVKYNSLFENFSFKDYIKKEILPEDATSLQFTEPFTAVNDSGNSKQAIDEFARILLPDSNTPKEEAKHNEPYILRKYSDRLTNKVAKNKLETRLRKDFEIRSSKVSWTIDYAWNNERLLHLVKPVSFDLTEDIHIQDKSVRLLGYLNLLKQQADNNNWLFDLLVVEPQKPGLQNAYQKAIDILNDADTPKRIITEENLEEYADETALNLNKELL